MTTSDTWRRQFPTASLLDVVDALADLVADRVAERIEPSGQPAVEKNGFSVKEAALYTGIGASTLRRQIDAGEIRAGRIADRVVIRRDELDRLMLGEAS